MNPILTLTPGALAAPLAGLVILMAGEAPAAPGRAMLVLDASGSMWGEVKGQAKIDVAKEVIKGLLETVDPRAELGLVAYGHRSEEDCADIELLIAPGAVEREVFGETVDAILPQGMTPLTAAVEMAAEALGQAEAPASVILVSDGNETCGGDLCALAEELAQEGVRFRAHVVAFDLPPEDAKAIRCLADLTGGRFFPAQDATSFRDALGFAIREAGLEAPGARPPAADEREGATGPLVAAPESVVGGSELPVTWRGPDRPGDYITIVPPSTAEGEYHHYAYTRSGSPLELTAPLDAGTYEIRYVSAEAQTVIARTTIQVTPQAAAVSAPPAVVASAAIPITWRGPNGVGDFITVVEPQTIEGEYGYYAYTRKGNPIEVQAPLAAGNYEIRYVTGEGRRTLARTPITVTPAAATLSAPDTAPVGAEVPVVWTGPADEGDYITIVPPGADEGVYTKYQYVERASDPVTVAAPIAPGTYEIRYVTGLGGRTLAAIPIEIGTVGVTLDAPDEVEAGAPVRVGWTGPANEGDYITIIPPSAEPGRYLRYTYAKDPASPATVTAPDDPGVYEVRYVAGQGGTTLARAPIKVVPAGGALEAPERAVGGTEIAVSWSGPVGDGDRVTVVPKESAAGAAGPSVQVGEDGGAAGLEVPGEGGEYEIRYVSGETGTVLASRPLAVAAE